MLAACGEGEEPLGEPVGVREVEEVSASDPRLGLGGGQACEAVAFLGARLAAGEGVHGAWTVVVISSIRSWPVPGSVDSASCQ